MAERPSPQRLLILWALQDEYVRLLAPALQSIWISVKLESEVPPPPPPPEPGPKPTAEDVPRMDSTQAAYEVFRGIDELMGDADEFLDKSKQARAVDRSGSEALPLHVEYRLTLRREPMTRGAEVAFAAGFAETVDREALVPRFVVLGNDGKAGQTTDRPKRTDGPGATFHVSMLEYCDLIEDLRRAVQEFGPASDLPLPDGWFSGTKLLAFLSTRVLPAPAVAAALRGSA